MNSKSKGQLSQAIVLAKLVESNMRVLIPFGDNERYDLAVDQDGILIRIQCKTGRLNDSSIVAKSCSNVGSASYTNRDYRGEADLFSVYSPQTHAVYLVPVMSVGRTGFSLRLKDKGPLKRGNALYAPSYELDVTNPPDLLKLVKEATVREPVFLSTSAEKVVVQCATCGDQFARSQSRIGKTKIVYCSNTCIPSKIIWPSDEELARLVDTKPTTHVARELHVSDKAVAKHCELRGIPIHSRGYWSNKAALERRLKSTLEQTPKTAPKT